MDSANRLLTRRALEMLKSIAVGEYKSPAERKTEAEAKAKEAEAIAQAESAAPVEEPSSSSEEETKS
jgi:hypothetical protein